MNRDYIRQWCVDGDTEEIKSLLLSLMQREIVLLIWGYNHEWSTKEIAEHFETSIQPASAILSRLYKNQYLRRDEREG